MMNRKVCTKSSAPLIAPILVGVVVLALTEQPVVARVESRAPAVQNPGSSGDNKATRDRKRKERMSAGNRKPARATSTKKQAAAEPKSAIGNIGTNPRVSPGRTSTPASRSTGSRPVGNSNRSKASPKDVAGKTIDIPPMDSDVPPEERTYSFGFKECTYEMLIGAFARQTGLGVIGETPPGGKVNFVTTERLSFLEAMSRIRMLLFNFKPHEPYWLRREQTHLEVVRMTDLYRELRPDQMHMSVEAFRLAGLPEEELALLIYTPVSGTIQDLQYVQNFMPDYVRVAPYGTNSVTIFALVRDINRYLEFTKIFGGANKTDPRTLEPIKIEFMLPSEVVEKLNALMDTSSGSAAAPRSRASSGRRSSKEAGALNTLTAPGVVMLPLDEQGVLLVRGMKDKIAEIKRLLPYVDVDTSVDHPTPVTIDIEHAGAAELAETVRAVLAAFNQPGPAGASAPKPKRPSRRIKSAAASMTPVSVGDVTLIVHPFRNALIVIGDDEGVEKVRALIKNFDKPSDDAPLKISLQHVNATQIISTITNMLTEGAKPKGIAKPKLIADPSDDAIWFTGNRFELKRIQDIVAILDVAGQDVVLHIFDTHKQKPSFIVGILTQIERETMDNAKRTQPKPVSKPRRVGQPVQIARFTANDDQKRLYVLCTDEEWTQYLPVIEQLEGAIKDAPTFVRFALKHIDADYAIIQAGMAVTGDGPKGAVHYLPVEGGVLAFGLTPAQVDQVTDLLNAIDVPFEIIKRTFEIRLADPAEIESAILTLVAGEPVSANKRPRSAVPGKGGPASMPTPEVTVFRIGDRLIVHAVPEKMEEVTMLIAELDQNDGETELRVYDGFAPGTDVDDLVSSLLMGLDGGSPKKQRKVKSGKSGVRSNTPAGPRFIPQPLLGRIVVIADPSEFPKIEELLEVLRGAAAPEPFITNFIELEHAGPEELVALIAPLLEVKIKELLDTGKLKASVNSSSTKGARRPKGTGAVTNEHFHIDSDVRNNRLVISAPQILVDEVKLLVRQFDHAGHAEGVFETVTLSNSKPDEMVRAIQEMMGASTRRAPRASKKSGAPTEAFDSSKLTVVQAPGGQAVIVHGPKLAVEKTIKWIKQLDGLTNSSREIKVYEIQSADITRLAEMILNVVDVPDKKGAKAPRRRRAPAAESEFEDVFNPVKNWTGQDLYIQADLIASTMIVAAPPSKIPEIDAIVKQFDDPEEAQAVMSATNVPTFVYEMKHRDAFDGQYDLDMALATMWNPPNELPTVTSFGKMLVVKYPYEDRFPEIKEMIEKYVDLVPDGDDETIRRTFQPPPGLTAQQAALWLQMKHPELDIEIRNLVTEEPEDYGIEELMPPSKRGLNRCVLPRAFSLSLSSLLAATVGQGESDADGFGTSDAPKTKDRDKKPDALQRATQAIQSAGGSKRSEAAKPKDAKGKDDARNDKDRSHSMIPSGAKLRVGYDSEKGVFVIEGPAGVVDNVGDWMDELKEEIKDMPVPPDIRHFRVRYIDVYSAAEILEEMFNATRQQLRNAQQQARLQQQQAQAQARAKQQQARAAQQNKGQQPGQVQRPGQQPTPAATAQPPQATIRIYPNPRDRSLIVRADASQFPAVKKLLAVIDQPQPIDSEFRVFKIKKLNAGEVEELLKGMLGLDAKRPSRSSSARSQAGGRATGSRPSAGDAGYLPRTIMQEMVNGAGVLGVDAKDIKLTSNEQTNTIIAMAPKEALDFIGDLITRLESENIPDRITKFYQLEHADVETVTEYLEARFGDGRTTSGKRTKTTPSGGSLNTPTFIPFLPLQKITVLATDEQIEEIDGIIERLDVASDRETWVSVALSHADPSAVAGVLAQMFSGSSAVGKPRGPRGSGATEGPKFIGQEGGRIVLFRAEKNLHGQINDAIERLESDAAVSQELHIITVKYAKPSKMAEAIQGALAQGGRTVRGRTTTGKSQLTVTPDDSAGLLFVRSDAKNFEEVQSLIDKLDRPTPIGVQFKIFPLKYANARQVYTQMTNLMTDYLRRLGAAAGDMDAFSVDVDEQTNSLVVLADSPTVFSFFAENLATIDNPAMKSSQPGTMIISPKNGTAAELAQNINRIWGKKSKDSKEEPVYAEANQALNTLIVRGTQAQLDQIRTEFIDPLEAKSPALLATEVVRLDYADPDMVAELINRIFEDKIRGYQAVNGRAGAQEFTVIVTPDRSTSTLFVQAGAENMAFIKSLVAERDKEEVVAFGATRVRIYPIKYADPSTVATVITKWSDSRGQTGARKAVRQKVSAVAERVTQSVVVTASEADHLIIAEILSELDSDTAIAATQRKRHVLSIDHASATAVATQLTQVFRQVTRRPTDKGPTFVGDASSNTIIVNLTDDEFTEVSVLLESLDLDPAGRNDRVTEVYTVQYADANSLMGVVKSIFRSDGRTQRSPAEQVEASVDVSTQSLIVTASTKNHVVIAEVIKKADVPSSMVSETHTIKLAHADADDVTTALREVFRGRARGRRGAQPVQITADPATNSLVILANATELAEIESVLQSLDVEPENDRRSQIKTFRLVHADPESVQNAITQLFRGSRNPRDQVVAVPEFGSGSVVVSASFRNLERVGELIETLDTEDSQQQDVHVITLRNAESESVKQTLDEIFVRSRGKSGKGQSLSISALQGSKAILIRCRDEEFTEIESVIAQIDREETLIGDAVRVVSLLYGSADEMLAAMQEYLRKPGAGGARGGSGDLVGGVRISALTQSNALVLSGSLEDVDRVEATLKQLDAAGEKGSVPRVIKLEHAESSDVAPALIEMFTSQRGGTRGRIQPVIIPNDASKSIIVRASATDLAAIDSLIKQLDTDEMDVESFRLVSVSPGRNVTTLADQVESSINQSAQGRSGGSRGRTGGNRGRAGGGRSGTSSLVAMADVRSGTIILAGAPGLFDDAEKLINTLDKLGPQGGLAMRTIRIHKTRSEDLKRLVDTLRRDSANSTRSGRSGRRSGNRSQSRRGSSRRGG